MVSVRSLPEGPEYATNLKRTTVETLAIRLRFRHPRLRFLQNGISERKAWNHLAILPESDESSKVALLHASQRYPPTTLRAIFKHVGIVVDHRLIEIREQALLQSV